MSQIASCRVVPRQQAASHRNTDRSTFVNAYGSQAPWDIGKPQKTFTDKADKITGRILDAGCGTRDAALLLAGRGHQVTGIASLEVPIERAKRKAAERT